MKRLLICISIILISCKAEIKENVAAETLETAEQEAIETTEESTQQITLEIYDYAGLEPMLNIKNDKLYVINFWATWCAPCVKELPFFEKLNKEYDSKKVEVILVSLDFPNQYEKRLKPFIIANQLNSKVVVLDDVDSNSWIPKIDKNWSGAIPATLIYNKNKRQFYEQSFNYDELKKEVDNF